jgi:chemotaxis protein methyltransferase CheR
VKPDDVSYLAQMLRRRSGLALAQPWSEAMESRLAPVVRRFGFKDCDALMSELRHGRDALARAVTEAMTTNESSFFRDPAVFDRVRKEILPAILARRTGSRRLRIWSAACAAGQEPYSIAMLLDDHKLPAQGWTVDLIATDLSAEMVARAEQGLYGPFDIQRGLPVRRLIDHFTQEGANWRIGEPLRRLVTFRPFNLLDSFGWLDEVDVVFCRNVLMYFDQKHKIAVLDKIAEILAPDGYLILGPIETTHGLSGEFVSAGGPPGIFVRVRAALTRSATS